MTAWTFLEAAVYLVVAAIVLLNVVFVLPPLVQEAFLWIGEALRVPRIYSVRRVVAIASRMKRAAAPPSEVIAISERDRLNVIVRITDFQKARSH